VSHPSLELMITAMDGADDLAVLEHLDHCGVCAAEWRALQARRAALRALPVRAPPAGTWTRLEAQLGRRRRHRHVARAGLMALAAALAAVVAWPGSRPAAPHAAPEYSLSAWVARSQQLETELKRLEEPAVVEVEAADARAEIEDEIAWVDQCLAEMDSSAPQGERAALWRTRVTLLESLLKVRRPSPALVSL
jgi:hypothetical protein